MGKYTITVDTSWSCHSWEEITVEANSRGKAMYRAYKCFGDLPFKEFLSVFRPTAVKVGEDTPLWHKIYYAENWFDKPKCVRVRPTRTYRRVYSIKEKIEQISFFESQINHK